MRSRTRRLAISSLLLTMAAALACNIGASQTAKPDLAGTVTAQALTLAARSGTPALGAASEASLSVGASTECRAGPGGQYVLVLTLDAGGTASVVGKNDTTGDWIIENPAGAPCWIAKQNAVFSGDSQTLTDYPIPAPPTAGPPGPTQTPKPPKTPKATKTPKPTPTLSPTATRVGPNPALFYIVEKKCTLSKLNGLDWWFEDITISWHDNSNDEEGFRIYQRTREHPQHLIATIEANHTLFLYQINYDPRSFPYEPWDQFILETYNAAGSTTVGETLDRCS